MMKKADLIRAFTKDHYIDPARARKDKTVSVKMATSIIKCPYLNRILLYVQH